MLVENDPNTFLLYGGKIGDLPTDELWSLNIDTGRWNKLPSSGKERHSMACAVSGETLVVWGGKNQIRKSIRPKCSHAFNSLTTIILTVFFISLNQDIMAKSSSTPLHFCITWRPITGTTPNSFLPQLRLLTRPSLPLRLISLIPAPMWLPSSVESPAAWS